MKLKLLMLVVALAAAASGCRTHESMGNLGEKLDLSQYYLPNAEASKVVSVSGNTNQTIGATIYVQTHAVAVKETGPKETVAKFGEVYAFSPNFFAVHKDEPTMIHFLNLQ